MDKICDHKSVGMVVLKNQKLLLIERAKPPFGFAIPAGHVDDDQSFEAAAKRELSEEVGLKTIIMKLLHEGRKNNLCRRKNGTWHYWKIYQMETEGEIKRSLSETNQAGWYSKSEITKLANKTRDYFKKKITDEKWQLNPGLEPVCLEHLITLKLA